MANASSQNNAKKIPRVRSENDLELLKVILDSNPELKKKVIRFMQKNYSKVLSQTTTK